MSFRTGFILSSLILFLAVAPASIWAKPEAKQKVPAQARVEGFRSARFGMKVDEVVRAIRKDFSIAKSQLHKETHPTEKTVSLWVLANDILPGSGPAKVYYIFGFKSKRLIQVNVIWGQPVTEKPDVNKVVRAANQLRDHFIRKGFEKEGLAVNAALGEGMILVFRGKDDRGRMVVLLLTNPNPKGKEHKGNITLRLSYISNPENPDVFRIKEDDF